MVTVTVGLNPTYFHSLYVMEEEGSNPVMVELKVDEILIFSQFASHGGITYLKEEQMEFK